MINPIKKLFNKPEIKPNNELDYSSINSNFVKEQQIPEFAEYGVYYVVNKSKDKVTVLMVNKNIYNT